MKYTVNETYKNAVTYIDASETSLNMIESSILKEKLKSIKNLKAINTRIKNLCDDTSQDKTYTLIGFIDFILEREHEGTRSELVLNILDFRIKALSIIFKSKRNQKAYINKKGELIAKEIINFFRVKHNHKITTREATKIIALYAAEEEAKLLKQSHKEYYLKQKLKSEERGLELINRLNSTKGEKW